VSDVPQKNSLNLSEVEKQICRDIVIKGPKALIDQGWTAVEMNQFVRRKTVVNEIYRLMDFFEDRNGIKERTQFLAMLDMYQAVPVAVAILRATLRGKTTRKNKKTGEEEDVEPPTANQYRAAMDILNRTKVGERFTSDNTGHHFDVNNFQINIEGEQAFVKNAAKVLKGDSSTEEDLDPASREKIRNVLEVLKSQTGQAVDQMKEDILQDKDRVKRKKRKKKPPRLEVEVDAEEAI